MKNQLQKARKARNGNGYRRCVQRVVRRDCDTRPRWTVIHPDGEELGLLPVTFVSAKMARESARLWNKQYPGHRVIAPNDQAHA